MSERTSRYLRTLEQVLEVSTLDLPTAFTSVADLVAGAMGAEKVDVFVHERPTDSLVALGTSRTPLGRKQQALGLDRLPMANGGRPVLAFRSGAPFLSADTAKDPEELPGLVNALGVRSAIYVPLALGGDRALLAVASTEPGRFDDDDVAFAAVLARWIGVVGHRAQLTERLAAASREEGRRAAAEEIVTVVAHDLRNLLAPAVGRVQLLKLKARREGRLGEQRDAEAAERSLMRAARLVSDLLDAARIDQGLFEIAPGAVELPGLLREVGDALATADRPVEVRAPPELVITGDAARLRQVFENLIGNAVKHAPAGTAVKVEAAVVAGERDGEEWAQVDVVNEGAPIPAELAPRIFSRYVRERGSTGLGLGLHLAREIVVAHGGLVTLERAQSGARFRVRLPASD